MSDANDGWESVGDSNPMWNPRQTGSKKTQDYVELQADEKSWAMGYYLGCKTGVGENSATIHTIQMTGVGNKAHIDGAVDPDSCKVDFWGSTVMDGKIFDNIRPGMIVKVQWLGMQAPKKVGGKNFHGWTVQTNPTIEPIVVAAGSMPTTAPDAKPIGEAAPANTAAAPANGTPASVIDAGEDDDLPF